MTISRIILALLAGALTGGLLVTLVDHLFTFFVLQDPKHDWKYAPQAIYSTFVMATTVWLMGLVVIGGPFWLLMHKLQFTSWVHVVLAVPIPMFFISLVILPLGFHSLPSAMGVSLIMALQGVIVALCVWGVAYRAGT